MYKYYWTLFFSIIIFSSCQNKSNNTIETSDTLQVTTDTILIKRDSIYKIDITDFEVIKSTFPQNKTLSNVLCEYGIGSGTIHNLAEKSKETFDVRKIRGGNNFCLITSNDSCKILKYFIYEINPVDYIVYCFNEDLDIRTDKKEVNKKERIVEGEIETSLWNAIVKQNIPFDLALKLSDIFAWNIDFFGLQKGDKFKAHFSEIWVDSTFIRIDTIKSAIFNNYGKDYYAIPFIQDDRIDYFDYDGNSLRKAFLKAPLKYSRISSSFSNSRLHPVLKIRRPHHGVDYAAPTYLTLMSLYKCVLYSV